MIASFLEQLVGYVWNYPVVILCLFGGIFFSFRFLFIQFRAIPHAIQLIRGKYDNPNEIGQITHFQALAAALSATIGLGNIAGVAIAIATGGPGAVLWMWIVGFFGMATKFIECILGTHYRHHNKVTGEVRGGAMYYITEGLGEKWRPLAIFFAIAIAFAGIGSASLFQSNQAALAFYTYYNVPVLLSGVVMFFLVAVTVIGGIKRIGSVASKIVPLMCIIYISGALVICFLNLSAIPDVIALIFRDAFTGMAAAGGAIGVVVKTGVQRAIFSNEAGIGSAPIAHAAVKTDYPIREGIVASMGPFIDTIVVCSATAFVIILSGYFGTEMHERTQAGMSFESPAPMIQLSDSWTITSDAPPSEDPIRSFKEGENTLMYQPILTQTSPIQLPINLRRDDYGLRFSYYKTVGDLQLTLLDQQKRPLIQMIVFESGKMVATPILSGVDESDVTLLGLNRTGEWNSAIISPSGYLKEYLSEHQNQTLVIQPLHNTGPLYFDRFETVAKRAGVALTTAAFDRFFNGFGSIFIVISVFFFAFSTIITWSYYGETAVNYLFGSKAVLPYKWIFVAMVLVGSYQTLDVVVNFSDAMIGLLVIPNMIACLLLSGKVAGWSKEYFEKLRTGQIKPYK